VSAIGGLAVTNTKVTSVTGIADTSIAAEAGLCRSKASRQKLNTAVSNDGGRCWILPLVTALITMTKFYLEAVQDVCRCLHCFCARLILEL